MVTSLVYNYWKNSKPKSVMELSVRSFQQHLTGDFEILTCGDYFLGIQQVNSPRICAGQFKSRFGRVLDSTKLKETDAIVKLQAMIDSPRVSETFVMVADDHFLLSEATIQDLGHPISSWQNEVSTESKNQYLINRKRTYDELRRLSLPTYRFATHNAYRFEKQKLQYLIDFFTLFDRPLQVEILYQNFFFDSLKIRKPDQLEFVHLACVNDLQAGISLADCRLINWHNSSIEKNLPLMIEALKLRPEYMI